MVDMASIGHHIAPADPDRPDQRPVAGEQPAVHQILRGGAGQHRGVRIQTDGILRIRREARGIRGAVQHPRQQGAPHTGRARQYRDVAMARDQSLAVFQPAQFLHRRHGHMGIRTDAPASARLQVVAQREQAVAEVGLRRGADRDGRAAGGDAACFLARQVGGMHQRPAPVDREFAQQPLHRPRVAQRQAVLHFAHLFGDVDVHRRIGRQRGQHLAHRGFRNRTQAVERTAHAQRCVLLRAQEVEQAEETVHIVTEPPLAHRQFATIETAGHVEHRQQGHADAGVARSSDQRPGHGRRICVRRAVGLMVHVVELAHMRVAGFQHFGVQLRRHRVGALRRHPCGEPVHDLAPGPEAVFRVGLVFGQARHRPLEGVRMQVGDAGHAPAGVGGDDLACEGIGVRHGDACGGGGVR